ncbi:C2 domain containing protein [Acanthamoeba castellanii str. Neff]|uniref:C2 domain containing protein n=1 Tax=Acanthamoeba castellanii (strain ATCC 30010 / Neff) TaxID=1257118 RepID=L8GQ15_ACACF|nr:C2 domain containing protein [Acanthamoeba castellanii str. Neff]ELR15075.1 C2 domain containing protein [Acanthamoeba castellanii str. Neff]
MDDNIQFKINNPDIAVTSLRILGAQQFLTATESTQIEVSTSNGNYIIHRTFTELKDRHAVLKECFPKAKFSKFPVQLFSHLVKGSKLINDCLASYVKHAAKAAPFRDFITPRPFQFHLLHVSVLQGRNLAARDNNGKSDPFVRVSIVDEEDKVTGKSVKTETIKGTLNPVWKDEDFTFDLSDQVGAVTFSLWDWDRASRNDFLGRVTLKKDDIPFNKEVLRWFPLYRTKARQGDVVHGELLLRIHHVTSKTGGINLEPKRSEEEDIEAIQQCKAERLSRQEKKEKERPAGKLHLSILYNPPLGNWDGYLTVNVIEASKLPAKDRRGTSDPYVVLSLAGKRYRTKTVKRTTTPAWKETFYFYVPHDQLSGLRFEMDAYDWDAVSARDLIGDAVLLVEEMEPGLVRDMWVNLVGPAPTQKGLQKKLGKNMAEEGWAPKLPIVIVPVIEGYEKWKGERVWLSISKIGGQALSIRRQVQQLKAARKLATVGRSGGMGASSAGENTNPQLTAEDIAFKNRWIAHISLGPDGYSDPDTIKVRPVKGMDAVTYLDPGALTSPLSYVLGPLINNLQQLGYAYGKNLLAAGYDWRLPPHQLEIRDRYFTNLKQSIQDMSKDYGPVVLVGHSMGNRVIQYFLNWVMQNDRYGRKWIDDNVHTFMAVGAPWLGASKAIRGLVTGEKFGMDAFLNDNEAITFSHRIASTAFLLPVGLEDKHHHLPADFGSFTFLHDDRADEARPVPYRDFLVKEADAVRPMTMCEEYLMKNPLFGGSVGDEYILKAPPVRRLYAIYGINLDTEIGYVFKREKSGSLALDDNSPPSKNGLQNDGFVFKKGIVYETSKSKQGIVREMTGVDGFTCGDGTVSYSSLNHCARWRNDIPQLTIEELDGAEHREVLANRLFFKKMIEYVAEKVAVANMADLGALAHRLGIKAESLLPDISDDSECAVENA